MCSQRTRTTSWAGRVSITRGNGVTTAYDYDAASRMEELAHDLNSTGSDQTLTFTYNAAGQALSRAGANSAYDWPQPSLGYTNYVPNGLNQYATVAAASIAYDTRGNLTSDGTTTYGYDLYNRLTSAGSATFAYDPAGACMRQKSPRLERASNTMASTSSPNTMTATISCDATPIAHPAGTGIRSSSNAPNERSSSSSFSVHRAA